jgi:hypothetical protein
VASGTIASAAAKKTSGAGADTASSTAAMGIATNSQWTEGLKDIAVSLRDRRVNRPGAYWTFERAAC